MSEREREGEADLLLGVDVLHVVLSHVGAEKGALLADSLQAVLSILELQPAGAEARAALASSLAAFVAAISDAAAVEDSSAHGKGTSAVLGDGASDAATEAEEERGVAAGKAVEDEALDIDELRLAIECAGEAALVSSAGEQDILIGVLNIECGWVTADRRALR